MRYITLKTVLCTAEKAFLCDGKARMGVRKRLYEDTTRAFSRHGTACGSCAGLSENALKGTKSGRKGHFSRMICERCLMSVKEKHAEENDCGHG